MAAGLGGGSADAAAALRLARHASGLGDEELLLELGAGLGADVPAQISPGRWLATGAGEQLQELPTPRRRSGCSCCRWRWGCRRLRCTRRPTGSASGARGASSTSAARSCAPRWSSGRRCRLRESCCTTTSSGAAVSLCPEIAHALRQVREAGAQLALVSGSGPTVVGLFPRANALGRVERATAELMGRDPAPIPTTSVDAAFARAATVA